MRVIIALCSLLALSSTLPQLAKAELDISDRAALDSIIKEFIQNNPEVVRDTLIALAAREETEREQAGLSRVRDDQGDPVMGNPDGAITLYEFPTIIAAIANGFLNRSSRCCAIIRMSVW